MNIYRICIVTQFSNHLKIRFFNLLPVRSTGVGALGYWYCLCTGINAAVLLHVVHLSMYITRNTEHEAYNTQAQAAIQ